MAGKEKERVWNREGEEGEGLGREGGTEGRGGRDGRDGKGMEGKWPWVKGRPTAF